MKEAPPEIDNRPDMGEKGALYQKQPCLTGQYRSAILASDLAGFENL